jgi:hypothetical protein
VRAKREPQAPLGVGARGRLRLVGRGGHASPINFSIGTVGNQPTRTREYHGARTALGWEDATDPAPRGPANCSGQRRESMARTRSCCRFASSELTGLAELPQAHTRI